MTIKGLSDRRRLPRNLKVRLGQRVDGKGTTLRVVRKEENGGYPREVPHFVLDPEDGASDEVLVAYGDKPSRLRAMLAFEVETLDPHSGQEMVLNESNRAYGRAKGLRCRGDGGNAGEYAGSAETSDEDWSARLEQATGVPAVKLPNGRWQVRCWGKDCPKYLLNGADNKLAPGKDPDASCKAVIILRFFLLHPTTDRSSPDYLRVLASAEVASGSRNTMIDVKSGFDLLRFYSGGRTAAIPFCLERHRVTTTHNGTKSIHFPLRVTWLQQEVQALAMLKPSQVFRTPEIGAEMDRLRQLGANYPIETVSHLLPAYLAPLPAYTEEARPAPAPPAPVEHEAPPVRPQYEAVDPAEAVEEEQPTGQFNGPDDAALSNAERDVLKRLTGGRLVDPGQDWNQRTNPWVDESLGRLRELQRTFHVANGGSPDDRLKLGSITYACARWIVDQLPQGAEQRPAEASQGPPDDPNDDAGEYRQEEPPEPTEGGLPGVLQEFAR